MRVALTGASGYVGGVLAAACRDLGWSVLALSRRPGPAPWLPYALGDDPAKLPWGTFAVLIHAAYDFSPTTWKETLARNVEPGVALLRTAAQKNVRIVFISSISAYASARSNYGRAKLLIEKATIDAGGMVVRPGLVWGSRPGGVMGSLEKTVARSPFVPCLAGGALAQYLVHEDDLAACVTRLCAGAGTRPLYSATHPLPLPLAAILRGIAAQKHLSRTLVPVPWPLVLAGLRVVETLGFTPPFRSDSLVGLVFGNKNLEYPAPPEGVDYRPFPGHSR